MDTRLGDRRRLVVHVLPADLARGAQAYARIIRDALDQPHQRHTILTLFASEGALLEPDSSLGIVPGRLRRFGFDPRVLIGLRRWLLRHPADVIIAHGGEPLKYTALARRRNRPRLVYYRIGGGLPMGRGPGPRRALYRWLARRADVVAAVSEGIAEESAEAFGIPLAEIPVLPNARDPHRFRPARQGREGAPRLLFVSHLVSDKRPRWFIAAVEELRARGRRIAAELVGDGPLAAELTVEATRAGVAVLGRRSDVASLLGRADVFLFPSAAREGLPGVLIEASMSGLPIVATDVPGVRRAVVDGETGFVVPVDDFRAFVDAADRLVLDPDLRHRLGDAAREHGVAEFGIGAAVARWQTVIAQLLEDPGSSPRVD